MPLEHTKSKEALARNIEIERHAGKSEKQSVAIAYAVKREAQGKEHNNSNYQLPCATEIMQKLQDANRGMNHNATIETLFAKKW